MAKKVVVIGSGFGGLAAALRLRAKGLDITLVEKQPDLGGRARVFKKGSFIYDGGPTVITAPYLFEELFSLFNKKISKYVEIVPLDFNLSDAAKPPKPEPITIIFFAILFMAYSNWIFS